MGTPHPLSRESKWTFFQPSLGARSRYEAVNLQGGISRQHTVEGYNVCREGLLSLYRESLRVNLCKRNFSGDRTWNFVFEPKSRINLESEWARDPAGNALKIAQTHNGKLLIEKSEVEAFLQVCDALVGNTAVLLDPGRPKGGWWRTSLEGAVANWEDYGGGCIVWQGIGNFVVLHPVLLAIMTGLFRQAVVLTHIGYAEKVLESVSRARVEEALTRCDWRIALANAKALQRWIEVPVPEKGGASPFNYAFPLGYWGRFLKLQRAIRRHGHEKVFGEDLLTGWGLLAKSRTWTGAYSFWGNLEEKNTNEAQKRLLSLGRPLKRKRKKRLGLKQNTKSTRR